MTQTKPSEIVYSTFLNTLKTVPFPKISDQRCQLNSWTVHTIFFQRKSSRAPISSHCLDRRPSLPLLHFSASSVLSTPKWMIITQQHRCYSTLKKLCSLSSQGLSTKEHYISGNVPYFEKRPVSISEQQESHSALVVITRRFSAWRQLTILYG